MEKLFTILFILFYFTSFSQTLLTDSSLIIRPKFKQGETETYLVNEKYTIETGTLSPIKAEHDFKVTFTILDTTNGYTILYKTELIKTTNKRFLSESTKAELINGLNLTYKINKDGWIISLPDYRREQSKVIRKLDSIITEKELKKDDRLLLSLLRKSLAEMDGLEICLSSLILFDDIFTKPMFRDRKDYHAMRTMNIFYQPHFPGTAILELQKNKNQTASSTVKIDFIGNRDSAAKYMTPFYQESYIAFKDKPMKSAPMEMKYTFNRKYEISHPSGYPLKIYSKQVEFYLLKTVRQITMKLVNE
jgi:hypothetical protein